MANIFNNENSYINIRDKWLIGKWDELRSLEIEDIQENTERIEIAILIASAWQQTDNTDKVYFFVNIAIKWGCSKYTASQFLIAGLFNALGCLKATQTKRQNLISTFQLAIDIDDFSHTDSSVLAELRMREELKKLNILSSSVNNSLLDKEFNIKEPVVSGISNITKINEEKRNNLQLLILGMHRSGTSCITNLLKNMGAYFGTSNKSTGSNLENPKGFWERRDVRQITDTLLFSINTDWHKISGYYPEKVPSSIRCKALKDLDSILADLNQYKTWILKEPRLTILLPLIQCKFERPIAVCVYRNPLEVALSLQKRNGFPLNFGLALWEFYTISMINNTSDMDRIFVSYNALIDDPINGSSQICNALNNFGLSLKLPNENDLLYLVDSNLYRNKIHSYDLEEILTIGQLNLYERIKKEKNLFKTSISTTLRDNLSFYENIQYKY